MSYWEINLYFLGVAAVVLALAVVLRRPPGRFWAALGVAFAVLAVLTAIFDNLMIAAGLMTYTEHNISGVQIGLAPLEDFAYPLAGVLLLPALWLLWGPRDANAARTTRATRNAEGTRNSKGARETEGRRNSEGRRNPEGAHEPGDRAC